MLRHFSPYQRYPQPYYNQPKINKERRYANDNPVTHPNSIPLRRKGFMNFMNFNRRQQKRELSEQNPGTSSQRSSGPPPGFEERRWGFSDPVEGPRNLKRKIEEDKSKQRGKEKCVEKIIEEKREIRAKSTIHISNISISVTREDVQKCCKVFGSVESIKMFRNFKATETQFCFVKYQTMEQAEIAVKRLKGIRRYGRFWNVGWARRESKNSVEEEGEKKKDLIDVEKGDDIQGVENDEIIKFMRRSWFTVTEQQKPLKEIRKIIEETGVQVVNIVGWGLYGAIVVVKEGRRDNNWVEYGKELAKHFIKVIKVDESRVRHPRYAWIEVTGVPIQTWSIETMENIARKWGKLLAVDKETDLIQRMDVARLFIEINRPEGIDKVANLRYKDEVFELTVSEIVRQEKVEFLLSQESSLGNQPISPENSLDKSPGSTKEEDREDMDLGGQDDTTKPYGNKDRQKKEGVECEWDDKNSSEQSMKEKSEESNIQVNNTQVQETPVSHVKGLPRTPVFVPQNNKVCTEGQSRRGMEEGAEKAFQVFEKEDSLQVLGKEEICECCVRFISLKQKEDKEIGGDEDKVGENSEREKGVEERQPEVNRITRSSVQKRRGNGLKKQTPRKKGSRGVTFGKLSLKERIGKGKKGQSRRSSKKNATLQLHASTSDSDEIVNSGLKLCQHIGVKIKNKGPKRLEFEKFILEGDHSGGKDLEAHEMNDKEKAGGKKILIE